MDGNCKIAAAGAVDMVGIWFYKRTGFENVKFYHWFATQAYKQYQRF